MLNSKVMNYFFQSFKEEEGRAFAQVKTVDIKNLPFIVPSELIQSELVSIVDEILKENSEDISSDTTDLQNKIDRLVYKIYDLTEEEIQFIESK